MDTQRKNKKEGDSWAFVPDLLRQLSLVTSEKLYEIYDICGVTGSEDGRESCDTQAATNTIFLMPLGQLRNTWDSDPAQPLRLRQGYDVTGSPNFRGADPALSFLGRSGTAIKLRVFYLFT